MTNVKTPLIASVTVAYNGAKVLPRQLDALGMQTKKLDEIVVVDNASSDNTVALLQRDYPSVTVLRQSQNVGVGGGYAAGLGYAAQQKKYDWIWLLDQDSEPANDCLERLFEGLRHIAGDADQPAILAPLCHDPKSQMTFSASIWLHGLRSPEQANDAPVYFVDSVISSGALLRREAVESVGLPRADFFMDFVDHEYSLRLRRHGYKIAIVTAAKLNHVLGEPIHTNIFGFRKNWTAHSPWREYYMARNEVFTVWEYFPDWRTKSTVAQRLLRHALAVLLFGRQKLACLVMMRRGIADGRAGRLGIRYLE